MTSNRNLPLVDLSRPHYMHREAADFYLELYGRILEARAAGVDVQKHGAELPETGREFLPKSVSFRDGQHLPIPGGRVNWLGEPETYDWTVRDGVATVELVGPVVRRASWLSAWSGVASTSEFAKQLTQAMEHPEVSAVICYFDTPGGESGGLPEVAEAVFNYRGTKPLVAYVDNCCASAGYFLAAGCDEIVVAPNAIVGSIGSVYAFWDDSEKRKKEGLQKVVIHNSKSPRKHLEATSKEGKSELQELADDGAEIFAQAVAKYRGVSIETVWNDFGQGGVLTGQKAVNAGMADRLGDYESLVTQLGSGYVPAQKPRPESNTNSQNGDNANMSNQQLTPQNAGIVGAMMAGMLGALGISPSSASANAVATLPGAVATPPTTNAVATLLPGASAQPATDAKDAEIAALKQQLEAANKATADAAATTRAAQLDAAVAKVTAKLGPAQGEKAKVLFSSALDKGLPLDDLTAFFDGLPENTAKVEIDPTTGKADAGQKLEAPKDEAVKPGAGEPAKLSEEREAQLMNASVLGREIQGDK